MRLQASPACHAYDQTVLQVVGLVKDGVPQPLPNDEHTSIYSHLASGWLFDPVSGTTMHGSVIFQ